MASLLHSPSELSGVLNKVLQHFIPIQSTGIDVPRRKEVDHEDALYQLDPVHSWILQTFRVDPGSTISKPSVYQRYIQWSERREQAPMTKNALSYAIHHCFPGLPEPERGPKGPDGKKPYYWRDLTLR
jgi:phage/plasmid-associated DNA primase